MRTSEPSIFGSRIAAVVAILIAAALFAFGAKDELPVCTVSGKAVMTENGKVLPKAKVILVPLFAIPKMKYQSFVRTVRDDGTFSFQNIPAGEYTVEAYAKAHMQPVTRVTVTEGKFDLTVNMKPSEPYLGLYDSQHVYFPNEKPQFAFDGFSTANKIDVTTYKINFDEIVKSGGLEQVIWSVGRWNKDISTMDKGIFKEIGNQSYDIKYRDIEGTFKETLNFESLPKGFYWLSAKAGPTKAGAWLMITDIALITKTVHGEVLAYVSDLKTGKLIPDATISVPISGVNQIVGRTNSVGLCRFKLPENRTQERITVTAQKGDSQAIVSLYAPNDMDSRENLRAYLYTDRPVYRPGDTIQFKGIVRKLVGSQLVVPPAGTAIVEVSDPDGAAVFNTTINTNSIGSFFGSFTVGKEAINGEYEITIRIGDTEATHYVPISSYRKPEYSVSVQSEKPYFVRGSRAQAKVKSEYFFGGPVVGAKVSASIYRRPSWGAFGASYSVYEEPYDYGSGSGEYIGEVNGITDENGEFIVDIDTSNIKEEYSQDWVYTVEASVEDEGGKYYDGSGTVYVTRGEIDVFINSDCWFVETGESISLECLVTEFGVEKPIPNARVDFVASIESWSETNNELTTRVVHRESVTSDAEGKSHFSFSPKEEGSYLFTAISNDKNGNRVESTLYIFVSGSGNSLYGKSENVTVKLNKPKYEFGENCKAVILTSAIGGHALVTI